MYWWVAGYNFQMISHFFLVIGFALAEIDETQRSVAFHLGFHCLKKYTFKGFQSTKGYALPFYHMTSHLGV